MKFAPILGSNLTGRLGGIVASHNTNGTYFRRYVVPVNPNTTGQQAQRNSFAAVSQSWRGLSKFDQAAWTTAAPQHQVPNSTGGNLTLTGQALFMRMNTLRQRIGLALITTPPTTSEIPTITPPTVVVELDGSVTITFEAADEWNATGGGILWSASPLLSNGVNFNGQYVTVIDGSAVDPEATPTASQLPYSTVAGGRITFRFSAVTPDGRLSDYLYVDVDVPTQAIVTSFVVASPTSAVVTFSIDVDVADFSDTDFAAPPGVIATIVQAGTNSFTITGTGLAAGTPWTLNPAGAGGAYTPEQSGITT